MENVISDVLVKNLKVDGVVEIIIIPNRFMKPLRNLDGIILNMKSYIRPKMKKRALIKKLSI